ncbi:MAG: bifunctional serine/threonine-protein kinase/formylglycine-generating enzyme family protein [Bacteroidaceae bacterium]|nr:bifunctional serine/threonine-protein kinase/formylglycine-generating enzyme family protein [Bacteroidaceae bacterium]
MHHLSSGTLLQGGRYEIKRFIAAGGFGCTYEGVHTGLDKRVAIKEFFVKDFCNRDETTSQITVGVTAKSALFQKLRRKFEEEARALAKLNHPSIVSVSDVFDENGTSYYVMDYINGPSLKNIVDTQGPLSETDAVRYILQVADALEYVHKNNRLHLDVKPGNIMVNAEGKAQLIDFGASKQYEEESGENTATINGFTVGYAPTEQMGNDVNTFTPATDIYSLGATLYNILTGIKPISAATISSGEKQKPLPEYISTVTRNAIEKAMQINKNLRPQSMAEFKELFEDDTVPYGGSPVSFRVVNPEPEPEPQLVPEPPAPAPEPQPQPPTPEQKSNDVKIIEFIGAVAIITIIISVLSIWWSGAWGTFESGGDSTSVDSTDIEPTLDSLITINANGVDFNMVLVKAGTFTMGATPEQGSDAFDDEKPAHEVTITNDYYIGQTEVTQALWKAVMGDNPSQFEGDNLPVDCVELEDCQAFIENLNTLTGRTFRLPTEAEWEFAARGGNNSKGYKFSGSNNVNEVAWYSNEIHQTYYPVATKISNELGIYDMSGNVWEWCQDWLGNYSSSAETDPEGDNRGSVRGGGWHYEQFAARYCRVSQRWEGGGYPLEGPYYFGLRLVLIP